MPQLPRLHTTPFSSSHCGEVRAQTAIPPLRPRAAIKSSLTQKKEKKGSAFSRFQLRIKMVGKNGNSELVQR